MTYRDPKTGRWAVPHPFGDAGGGLSQPVTPPFVPVKIFVYGTLKRGYGLNYMLRDCEFVGEGVTTRRYRMIDVGFPIITPDCDGNLVSGELYIVRDARTLAGLDRVEGAYNRSRVEVTLRKGAPVECYIYEGKPEYWARRFQQTNWVKSDECGELTFTREFAEARRG